MKKKVAQGLLVAVVASNQVLASSAAANGLDNPQMPLETNVNTGIITEGESKVEFVQETQVEEIVFQEETVTDQVQQEEAIVEETVAEEKVVETETTIEEVEPVVEKVVVVEGGVGQVSTEEVVAASEEVTVISDQTANDYNELKAILSTKPNDITITLTGDIVVPEGERLEILSQSQNVVIEGGNQYSINLNEKGSSPDVNNKFYVRGQGTVIKDVTITGYKSSAMYLFNTATDVRVENVTLNGNGATVGIDLAGAKVTVKGIKSSNHKLSGIRLRNNAV